MNEEIGTVLKLSLQLILVANINEILSIVLRLLSRWKLLKER